MQRFFAGERGGIPRRVLTLIFPDGEKMTTEVPEGIPMIYGLPEYVSPARAARLLETREANRSIARSAVDKFIRIMGMDKWRLTHQGLALTPEGRIIDGQHRLQAIVDSGRGQWIFVCYNVPSESFPVIDDGRKRMLADDMAKEGKANTTARAAIVNLTARAEWGIKRGVKLATIKSSVAYTRQELLDYESAIEGLLDLEEAVRCGARLHQQPLKVPNRAGGALYCLARLEGYESEHIVPFVERVANGEGLYKGDPELALRDGLMPLANKSPKQDGEFFLALMIKAFNAYAKGDERKSATSFNASKEKFPSLLPVNRSRLQYKAPDTPSIV